MKKLAILLGLIATFLFIGQASAYDENYYLNTNSTTSDFSLTGYVNVSTDNGTCSTDVRVYADINGSSTYGFQLYINDVLTVENPTVSGSVTCSPVLSYTIPNSTAFKARARARTFGTAVPVNLYLEFYTTCTTNSGHVVIWSNDTNDTLTYGNNMYMIADNTASNGAYYWWGGVNDIPAHCTISQLSPANIQFFDVSGTRRALYYVPFSSGIGNVSIHWEVFGATNFGSMIGIYDPENNITTALNTTGISPTGYQTFNNNLDIESFHDFVAWVYFTLGTGATSFTPPRIIINISDYVPTYNCTAWSACLGGVQTRLCNDTGGVLPLTYQFRDCLAVNETAILGFENYYQPNDRWICQPIWYPLCGIAGYEGFGALANVTVLFPDNPRWSILPDNPLYYITTITSETATLGSRSLKLWYIPQSAYNDQPFNNAGTIECRNTTSGTFPEIFLPINTTFMASLDFTFPAGTTELRFDVKRCPENAIQYNNWCGKRCYAQNCSIEPSGDLIAQLFDQVTGTSLFQLTKEATINWTTYTAFIGDNAIADRNYTLIFSVLPLPYNPTETQGNCIYIDNVRLINTAVNMLDEWADELYGTTWNDLTDAEKQNVLLEKCVTECIGNDYHIRTIQDLTCIEEVVLNYSTCVTQQQQQAIADQSIFTPISSIANTIVNTTTNQTFSQSMQASGFGFVLVFLTPIFWIFLVIISVMILASYATKHMEIGGVAGLLMLVAFAVYFPELVWITIIIIIIGGYIIGRQIVRVVQGG